MQQPASGEEATPEGRVVLLLPPAREPVGRDWGKLYERTMSWTRAGLEETLCQRPGQRKKLLQCLPKMSEGFVERCGRQGRQHKHGFGLKNIVMESKKCDCNEILALNWDSCCDG